MTPQLVLNQVYGYAKFNGQQQQVIEHVLDGGSALVLMPTGGGKSLCYQIPALLLPGVTIVVSPLIALMQDQVASLRELGVAANYLSSQQEASHNEQVLHQVRQGQLKLLYLTPEKLVSDWFIQFLSRIQVSLIAIDEAHCVSHWGHDFRPEYQRLLSVVKTFPQVPRLALTATADYYTRVDILHYLGLKTAPVFATSFNRANLYYAAWEKNNGKKQLLTYLSEHKTESGIIYCNSRKKVDELSIMLNTAGIDALSYHAGLDPALRSYNQNQFLQSQARVMVATVAFGLGIDKPDVRFVYHFDLPRSIDHFYQESGRAGRDGLVANSLVNYGFKEVFDLGQMILASEASELKKRYELDKLKKMLAYCDSAHCRRQTLLAAMGEHVTACGQCDICLTANLTYDASVLAQKILSAIYRTQQRFAISHIIDVLRGKASASVQVWEHHKLALFGLACEYSEKELRRTIRQLFSHGLLEIDFMSGALKLNAASLPVLRGTQMVYLRKSARQLLERKIGSHWLRTEQEERIYHQLLNWRHTMAIRHKVSHHAILPDRSLQEMVQFKPTTLASLQTIHGIGQTKLASFGHELLQLISNH